MAMIGRRAAPTKLNASDISDNAITSAHIQADALTHSDLAPNSITASELADNAVDTAAIAADAVDGTKIADNAVDSEHIADDAVTGAKIENSPTIAANLTVAGTATLQGLTTIKPTVAGDQTVLTIDGDSAGNVGNFGIKRNGATLGLIETAYSDINITCQASGADLKINFGDYNNTAIKVKQSNGYVGIGQQGTFDDAATTPDYPLHITCNTKIDGNVGIGEGAPSGKLHVVNGSGITLPTLEASARNMGIFEGDNAENYIVTACPNDSTVGLIFADPDHKAAGAVVYAHGDNHMRFVTSTSERMRIDSSGKVGIGTAAPADQLHAIGTARINESTTLGHATNAGTAFEIRGDAIASGSTDVDEFKAFKIALNDATEYGGQAQFSVGRWEESGSYARSSLVMSLGHGGLNSSTNADVDVMTLRSDGRVGIGVAPSTHTLEVSGSGRETQLLVTNPNSASGQNSYLKLDCASTTGSPYLEFKGAGSTSSYIRTVAGTSGDMAFNINGHNEKMRIDSAGHITPGGDNTQDLGGSGKRWRNVYSGDLQLSNEGTDGNEVDGTTGEWTIQEGDENLFVLNRKTGKKFKMNLTEI